MNLRILLLLVPLISNTLFARSEGVSTLPVPADTARILPIASDGWAASSVNVVAGLQHTLVTEGSTQWAAFYAADQTLVIARRQVGSDIWKSVRTGMRGRVADAHNTVAIAVDGNGVLHVAWDHHGNPLNYARGTGPDSLDFEPRSVMIGNREERVTYPRFLRLPDGDLLFLYRDGASGGGNLVLNRFATQTGEWSRVQSNLIDGEGQRNAYAAAFMDTRGVLHLAWVWRESPDVSTNHDISFARSEDGGTTWTDVDGSSLTLPLTAATVEPVVRIEQGRSLMNPPSLAVDRDGRPYIANYWLPEGSEVPQFHLVHYDGERWQVQQVSDRQSRFQLEGTATRRPPLSRAAVVTFQPWRKSQEVYLIYRDDERDGRIVVAESRDLSSGKWYTRDLTESSVGAWEPSIDPVQWRRFQQIQMLVQHVEQRDGNDRDHSETPPAPIGSLIWSPFMAGLSGGGKQPPMPAAGELDRPLDAEAVLELSERVADWQLAHPLHRDPVGWVNAPFFIGALALDEISKSSRFHRATLEHAEAYQWSPGRRVYHADDHSISQAYLELFERHQEPRMLTPTRERFDAILANPASVDVEWGHPDSLKRWSWCDALFMAPVSWLMVFEATGDSRYLDFMNREWWATTDALYVPSDRLYGRDQGFLDVRERNGRGLYWSRGNGWVMAGLARVLERFPRDHVDYPRYEQLFREMAEAVLAAQQPDGLWRPGLLDPSAHPVRESSGSSFYTFALAWGVNHDLLDRERFGPSVRRAWNALSRCVSSAGKLEHVQPVGAAPEGFDPRHTEPFGVGAFLLAGSEVYRFANGMKPSAPR